MTRDQIIQQIDEEIERLKHIQTLLTERNTPEPRERGRRKGHKLSPEARAKIAAAQRRRWARERRLG